jgi:hypothetical protein
MLLQSGRGVCIAALAAAAAAVHVRELTHVKPSCLDRAAGRADVPGDDLLSRMRPELLPDVAAIGDPALCCPVRQQAIALATAQRCAQQGS